MELLSVVVPTHNRRDIVISTVNSILDQTYEHLELIVCDDGSSDGTSERLSAIMDPRLRVERLVPNGGVAAARNRGLELASGTRISFCDDDDLWMPDKLENQVRALQFTEADWVYSGVATIDPNDWCWSVTPGWDKKEISLDLALTGKINGGNAVPGGGSNVMVSRALINRVGGFDENLSMLADWDLWIRLCRQSPPVRCSQLGVLYRHHPDQMSFDQTNTKTELQRIRGKYGFDKSDQQHTLSYEPIDKWIAQQMWPTDKIGSVKYALDSPGILTLPATLATIARARVRKHRAPKSAWRAAVSQYIKDNGPLADQDRVEISAPRQMVSPDASL